MMPQRRATIELVALGRKDNHWYFKIDLDHTEAERLEAFMLAIAGITMDPRPTNQVLRMGWMGQTWWADDRAMWFLSHFFSNWEEMAGQALAVETTPAVKMLPE
jgi:hypothetical protein